MTVAGSVFTGLFLLVATAARADTVLFVSDETWDVFAGNPSVPPGVPLGKAKAVCLNSSAPFPCPPGAVAYGSSNAAGWLANLASIPGAKWIWAPGIGGGTAPAELAEFFFARTLALPSTPIGGSLSIASDDLAEVLVNGVSAGVVGSITASLVAAQARNGLSTIDIGTLLVPGNNTIVVRAQNGPPSFAGCEPGPCTYAQDPAGVVFGGALSFGQPNLPPDCSGAVASRNVAWPPNHKLVSIGIRGVTDREDDPIAITVNGITQDEPVNDGGDGDTCPDAGGIGTSTASVLSERSGQGDGRVYHIAFVADDGHGGQCLGSVAVCVPHDQGHGRGCGDGGPLFDSTGTCGSNCTDPAVCGACTLPGACSDGDPCTVDVCTAEGCRHDGMTGLPGCRCWIDHDWSPPACSGQDLPAKLETRLAAARRLVAKADDAGRGRRAVGKALRQLRLARHLARGSHAQALPEGCASAVAVRIDAARAAAKGWLATHRRRPT